MMANHGVREFSLVVRKILESVAGMSVFGFSEQAILSLLE